MKIVIKIFFFLILFNVNAKSNENYSFGLPSYWDNLKEVQKNFYMKGALDSMGYYLWNNAPDTERDILISQYRFCIEKESENFQRYMFMLGWNKEENAATEIYKWSSAACSNLSETKEFKDIVIEKKPLENVIKKVWAELTDKDKAAYIAGYVDGSLDTVKSIIKNPNATKDDVDYYQNSLNTIYKCFEKKGFLNLIPFIIKREINDSYPVAWNISFSMGAFCR
mgnify:FL=1